MIRLTIPSGVEYLLDDSDLDAELTAARRALQPPYKPTDELRRLVAEEARRGVNRALHHRALHQLEEELNA
jgi:hypothetical protein